MGVDSCRSGGPWPPRALFFLVPLPAALIAWAPIGAAMPPLAWLGMALAAGGVTVAIRAGRAG